MAERSPTIRDIIIRDIIIALLVAVLGGVIVAMVVGEGRFAPKPTPETTNPLIPSSTSQVTATFPPAPTQTKKPTSLPTSTPKPTLPPTTQAKYVRGNLPVPAPPGWAYEQEGVQLNLVKAEVRTSADYGSAAAHLWFALLNKSPQRLLVEFDQSQVYITDSRGARYVDYDGPGVQSFWMESGELKIIDRYYTTTPQRESRIPPSALPVIVHVDRLSRVQSAQWIIGGSPIPTYSNGDVAGHLGDSLNVDDFEVALIDLEVRTTEDSGSAAFRASFSVKNKSNQRRLLELDYAYIYIEDNSGTRYIDYDGGGLVSTWIDPGQEYTFDRYYSAEYNTNSRVPVGTSYVVVVCEGVGSGSRAQWRIDIVR
jgi:hypothetical protein